MLRKARTGDRFPAGNDRVSRHVVSGTAGVDPPRLVSRPPAAIRLPFHLRTHNAPSLRRECTVTGEDASAYRRMDPFAGLGITVRELRLVALPNQLLLAGIPDTLALRQRQAFCERLLTTDWQAALRLRHGNTPLPAPFWHTTLLRYQADCLPESLRRFSGAPHAALR